MSKNTINVSLSKCDCDKLINNIKSNLNTNTHKLKLNDIKCNVSIDDVSYDTNINYVIMKGGSNHNTGKICIRVADQLIEYPLKKINIIDDTNSNNKVLQKGGTKPDDEKSEPKDEQEDNPDLYKKKEKTKVDDNLKLVGYDKEILNICQ